MSKHGSKAGDTAWGVRWGLSFACCYAVVAIVIYTIGGALSRESLWPLLAAVVAAYFIAGAAAGAVVGLMRRKLDTIVGVCTVALAAGIPAWAAIGTVARDQLPYAWDRSAAVSYVFCVVVVGPLMGLAIRHRLRR